MSVTPITNHIEEAIQRLPMQYRGKPKMEALVSTFGSRAQVLEDLFQAIDLGRRFENAAGVQLTGTGSIVGQPRNGHSDSTYRPRIQAKILINRASGTTDQVLDIVKLLAGEDQVVHLVPQYPAGFLLYVLGDTTTDPPEIVRAVALAKAAGVRVVFVFDADDVNTARYDSVTVNQRYDDGGYAGTFGI